MSYVQVISSEALFTESRQSSPITVPLSIIDATVARFSRTAAVWYFDAPAPSLAHWRKSISKTLTSYPQWCGRLSWSGYIPKAGHTNRLSRVHLTYNTPSDPGVLFVTGTSQKKLAEIVPSISSRKVAHKIWDSAHTAPDNLLPKEPLALRPGSTSESCPMQIQITTFACGGIAIALAITHSLADAQALSIFVKDWSATSRAILDGSPLPKSSPVFEPQLLDSTAAGDIDAEDPNVTIQEQARQLPCHRFDWYIPVPNQPSWTDPKPDGFEAATIHPLSPSTPLPWADWDLEAKCGCRVFHFTPEEIAHIFKAATVAGNSNLSKHEALIAHVWSSINRARNLPPDTTVYLDHTFGLRQRLEPRLPENFLGSPLMLAAIPRTSSKLSDPTLLHETAAEIHDTLRVFGPKAIAAHLHDAAFEPVPQRLWQAFLGSKHVLLTTWIHIGVWSIDFGGTGKLRCVQPVMPLMDGIVEVMEAGKEESWKTGDHWTSGGVDVSIYLEEVALRRLEKDPALWGGGCIISA